MPYSVRTPVYEGPFDLLLHLNLRSEVELFELSLSTIVDEYIVEIERMDADILRAAIHLLDLLALPVGDERSPIECNRPAPLRGLCGSM